MNSFRPAFPLSAQVRPEACKNRASSLSGWPRAFSSCRFMAARTVAGSFVPLREGTSTAAWT